MVNIKFPDYKEDILKALNEKSVENGIHEPNTLIEGFISQPLYNELTWGLVIWWPTIPMVAVVGNSSWRIYFFALKILLPKLDI